MLNEAEELGKQLPRDGHDAEEPLRIRVSRDAQDSDHSAASVGELEDIQRVELPLSSKGGISRSTSWTVSRRGGRDPPVAPFDRRRSGEADASDSFFAAEHTGETRPPPRRSRSARLSSSIDAPVLSRNEEVYANPDSGKESGGEIESENCGVRPGDVLNKWQNGCEGAHSGWIECIRRVAPTATHRVWVEMTLHAGRRAPPGALGVLVEGGVVQSVVAGFLADRASLRRKSRLVAIDTMPIAGMDPGTIDDWLVYAVGKVTPPNGAVRLEWEEPPDSEASGEDSDDGRNSGEAYGELRASHDAPWDEFAREPLGLSALDARLGDEGEDDSLEDASPPDGDEDAEEGDRGEEEGEDYERSEEQEVEDRAWADAVPADGATSDSEDVNVRDGIV